MKSSSALYRLFLAWILIVLSTGCYPEAKIPMETIHYNTAAVDGPKSLMIFLPGNGDSISVFEKEGLIEAVRKRGLPIDMVAVNAHIGYYMNWSILERMEEDVIEPLRIKDYQQIWLVGDSMGAYGSISYAKEHEDVITGVVLLGPFLGDKQLINEIKQSGGLSSWNPGDITSASREAWERSIWAWLRDCQFKSKRCPSIYLGYGRDDRFAYMQDYLASIIRADHVFVLSGNHSWRTWKKIWIMLLDKDIFRGKQ